MSPSPRRRGSRRDRSELEGRAGTISARAEEPCGSDGAQPPGQVHSRAGGGAIGVTPRRSTRDWTVWTGLAHERSSARSCGGSRSITTASRWSSVSLHRRSAVHHTAAERHVHPRLANIVRAVVERTLAWISRNRRLARDYERHARKAATFVCLAMIRLMLRRLSANR
jgi:transposase